MGIRHESYVCVLSSKAFKPVSVCIKDRQTHLHASLHETFLWGDIILGFFLHFIDIYGMKN